MATTFGFKEYERLARTITVEDLFNMGMNYSNTPLDEGFAKLLVNYELKNQGTSLVPRGGLTLVSPKLANQVLDNGKTYAVHHVGLTMVSSADGQDATVHKYILVAALTADPVRFDLSSVYCFVEADGEYICASYSGAYYTDVKKKLDEVHDVPIAPTLQCNSGLFVSVEANTYFPVYAHTGTVRKFMRMELKFTSETDMSLNFIELVPRDVPAAQVINAGYNMMKADPYAFPNTDNATGGLVLGGVIPKDAQGNIKLTADVGETLIYHLQYTYPAGDAEKKYMVQWEVKNTATSEDTTVVQQVRMSPRYTPGNDITYSYTVPYKQFTIVAKVYDEADLTAHPYVSDEDDAKSLTPLKVITVSSYYTTAGTSGNTANLTARKYDLTTCKGLATWQQRMVVWGVTGASTTLFVSQPNLPEYVPYPNNVEVFQEDIVRCIPYMTYLLVFTTSKLYRLDMTDMGYMTKCIQERLIMTEADAATIRVVKNMVYFKSGNYFYMIVPNNAAGAGELQLAPVSRPVEFLLDNFEEALDNIINSVYNIPFTFGLKEGADDSYTLALADYSNYLDGSVMRNVYKAKLDIYKDEMLSDTRYIDFIINYDTVLRAWTTHMQESNVYRLVPYESTVTVGMLFVDVCPVALGNNTVELGICKHNTLVPKDTLPIYTAGSARKLLNHQLIDTGYRAHFPAFKKRFREIQFSVNNTEQSRLAFHTSFTVDDDVRRSLFEYNVQQITDTASPDYGLVYVERGLADALEVSDTTNLGIGEGWTLDFSMFPEITVAKVRYKVSGKGYLGKISILSKNEVLYELLGTNWVYRKMNGR